MFSFVSHQVYMRSPWMLNMERISNIDIFDIIDHTLYHFEKEELLSNIMMIPLLSSISLPILYIILPILDRSPSLYRHIPAKKIYSIQKKKYPDIANQVINTDCYVVAKYFDYYFILFYFCFVLYHQTMFIESGYCAWIHMVLLY
ncbi:hypothetical protein BCR42DRAFT_409594 [Absidia repens]|uniref:Uncharacterized protein n=1 Tax=Absidia repens TaxID=90262 RepID=A0A1X2IMT8_9FUNG|nr:hypothetical protein BCR42DRAFT_409594 [Absidia repens]